VSLNKKTFQTRTLTAIVFVVVMLAGLLINQWTFYLLFFIIHLGCWMEFIKLSNLIDEKYNCVNKQTKIAAILIGCGFLIFCIYHDVRIGNFYIYYAGIYIMIAGALYFIFRWLKENKNVRLVALKYALLGLLYLSLTWGTMINLRGIAVFYLPLGYIAAITLVAAIWMNDTMQYLVGSLIGKNPFSKISPNKTLEGTLGGSLLCIVLVSVIGYFYKKDLFHLFILIALIAAIAGTCGDLLESKIKRLAGVKDSGNFMPGHGGFLDRFDSLILSVPFVWIVVEMVKILFQQALLNR